MEDMQREYWNELAGPKWVDSQAQMDETLAPYSDALRQALRLGPGTRVVDVGCGCGATTLMAHQCATQAEILGLDVSEPMLARAEERAARLRSDRIRFLRGDAATEQIEPQSVDRIISRFGVMFFAEPARAFAHMRSWLKPDGRMVVVVWAPRDENPWMSQTMALLAQHVELPPSDPDAPGPFALGDAAKRSAVFAEAGLLVEEERVLDRPVRIRGDVDTVTQFFTERGPAALALQSATAEARDAAVAALREFVESIHDGRGASIPGKALRLTLAPDPNAPEPPGGDTDESEAASHETDEAPTD